MSVYFAQAGRYIKIGYSADPIGRMSTVTTAGTRPDDLPRNEDVRPLGWIPGDQRREIELHVRFADQRVAGEWFVLDADEMSDLIWSDPRGIDIERMSAMAVFVALKHPEATREDMAAAGVRVESVSTADVFGRAS